jgi:hypothetical protein
LYFQQLGTAQKEDKLFGADQKQVSRSDVTTDDRYLVISAAFYLWK